MKIDFFLIITFRQKLNKACNSIRAQISDLKINTKNKSIKKLKLCIKTAAANEEINAKISLQKMFQSVTEKCRFYVRLKNYFIFLESQILPTLAVIQLKNGDRNVATVGDLNWHPSSSPKLTTPSKNR